MNFIDWNLSVDFSAVRRLQLQIPNQQIWPKFKCCVYQRVIIQI